MSIKPERNRCKREPTEFRAILLGPLDSENKVEKIHICKGRYDYIIAEINSNAK